MSRALQKQAQQAGTTAAQTGAGLMSSANNISSTLEPMLQQDLTTRHGMSPDQLNELLDYAGAGTGGATGGITGQAELESARTGQGAGLTPALDAVARTRQQALAKSSEGVASQDVNEALRKQQAARGELAGLYGTDVKGALDAMGLVPKDVEAGTEAGKSGWFQNMTSLISALNPGGKAGPISFGS